MSISDMTDSTWTVHGMSAGRGVTFGKQNTTTRTTESVSTIFAVTVH